MTKSKGQRRMEKALELAKRLSKEGRAFDANIIRDLARSASSSMELNRRLHADNRKLRDADQDSK